MPTMFASFMMIEWPVFLTKLWEQFYIVCIATLIALVIGLPLGILIRRLKTTKSLILGIVSALWTVPSLALLALFIPVLGIGVKPAIIVLSIYAVLPVIRNTVAGLENISPEHIEAARGLGFTRLQRLWIVELPLALPVIITGIRISISISIGVATLASFVGAGGLGDFINQGLALNNTRLILLGAIPAAMMALLFDYAIASVEKYMVKRDKRKRYRHTKKLTFAIALVLLAIGVNYAMDGFYNKSKSSIRLATKNFTEQIILGELMSQLIEAKTNLHVIRKFNLGTTAICHVAIVNNEIDIYPEYTGTAYLDVLKSYGLTNADQLFAFVKDKYQRQFKLIWLNPFGFNNSQALAVRRSFAKKYHLTNISDLIPVAQQLKIGVPPGFMKRADGLSGLKRAYNLQFGEIKQIDPALMYDAIQSGTVNLVNAFSTDGRIPAHKLVVLNDNKHFYPAYYAAPIMRADIMKRYPEVAQALKPLLGRIDNKTMQQLNYQVDFLHKTPYMVAKTYLHSHKLIS